MKYVWKTLGIYLAFLIQSLLFENLNIFSCSPDILMTVVIIVAVAESFVPASVLGGFAGLLNDVMYGEVFGTGILFYLCLSLAVSLAADSKNINSPLIMSWICFISVAATEIVLSVLRTAMGRAIEIGHICAEIFVKGIFAAVFALVFVLASEFLKKRKKNKPASEVLPETEVAS